MKICETGRARVVARIGGQVVLPVWVGIAGALSGEGSCVRQVVANWEDELEDSNGRYAARTMRCGCGSLRTFRRRVSKT
jgi:hypothetical protein